MPHTEADDSRSWTQLELPCLSHDRRWLCRPQALEDLHSNSGNPGGGLEVLVAQQAEPEVFEVRPQLCTCEFVFQGWPVWTRIKASRSQGERWHRPCWFRLGPDGT